MKHIRKTLALLLALSMVIGSMGTVYADDTAVDSEVSEEIAIEETQEEESVDSSDDEIIETVDDTSAETEEPAEEIVTEEVEEESDALMATDDASVTMTTVSKNQSVPLDTNSFYRIFHLDAGRKYFSVDQITDIIDTLAKNGYSHMELALGNDALRFILDDMSVAANGTTYSDDAVTNGVITGNNAYASDKDSNGNYLTQAEMDTILAYASSKNIQIIPLINTPGHMDSILDAMEAVGINSPAYNNSARTVDVTNDEAVNFTLALVNKYIEYFAGKGVKIFNMGADEYANDVTNGFSSLISAGQYGKFIEYINNMAAQIQNAGMTAMAFNDGIYYNNTKNAGTIDTNIAIAYWTSGWGGYDVRSASDLISDGFKIINTNDAWYYVLGRSSGTYSLSSAQNGVANTAVTSVSGSSNVTPAGSMNCVWCDTPSAAYSDTEVANVKSLIESLAKSNTAQFTVSEDPEEPVSPDEPKNAPENVQKTVNVTIEVGQTSGTYSETSGAYSEGTGLDTSIATATVTPVSTSAGVETKSVSSIASGSKFIIANSSGRALSNQAYYRSYLSYDGTVSSSDGEGNEIWTITQVSGGYTIQDQNGRYLNISNGSLTVSSTAQTVSLSYSNNSGWTISRSITESTWWGGTNTTTYYVRSNNSYANSSTSSSRWSIYQVTATEDSKSTNVQFTGVKPGTTSMVVGETQYNVTVTQKQQAVSVTKDDTVSYTDASASTAKVTSGSDYVTVSTSGNRISFKGVAEGTAVVETTNCVYTITVAEEDVSNVNPLTVYLWITNNKVAANGSNTASISAQDAYGVNGKAIADLLPETGTWDSHTVNYWRTNYHPYGTYQAVSGSTAGSGENTTDQSENGTVFNFIRYYQGAWAYSVDGTSWDTIAIGGNRPPRIEAYYMQRTDVTDEVYTDVKDWGEVPHTKFNSSQFVLVDYSVKYESGQENPSSFPVSGKTMAFHCVHDDSKVKTSGGNYYRQIGMIRGVETADYEIYMITVTQNSDYGGTNYGVADNSNAANRYSYNGTEYVAWADSQETIDNSGLSTYTSIGRTYTYSIGGDPNVSGLEIYEQHAMKVTYYVRAKVTEDDLTVNYVDDTTGTQFYTYGIKVNSGTTFKSNIGLNNQAVVNGDVVNSLGITQNVSSDLSTMPIAVAYRYSNYTVVKLDRSEDGKTVTIHYTFNNTHSYVIDFGLPVTITTTDLGISGNWNIATVSGAQYGTATATVGGGVTYTPNTTLKGVEQLNLMLTGDEGSVTHVIYIYPATTVYYEEGFMEASGFNGGATSNVKQNTAALGSDSNVFGYDAAYGVNGTVTKTTADSTAASDKETFSFTGTGFTLYADCSKESGTVFITVKNDEGAIKKVATVNTASINGTTDYTEYPEGTLYNVPIYSLTELTHGEYTVSVTHVVDTNKVSIDGFRVYNTIADSTVFTDDLEDNPTFIEVRDLQLGTVNIADVSKKYPNATYKQVYSEISDAQSCTAVLSTTFEGENLTDYIDNGPKNEIYLRKGMSLTLNIGTLREAQIGLRGLQGNQTASINSVNTTVSTTDMFYKISDKGAIGTVTITNNSDGILAVTTLKVCDSIDDLAPLTEEDIKSTLIALGLEEEDDVVENPFKDVKDSAYYYDAVLWAVKNGVTSGKTADTFGPNDSVTRGQVVTFLWREAGEPESSITENPFKDVSETSPFYKAILWAYENGITSGTDATHFSPNSKCTRGQIVTFLWRYAEEPETSVTENPFSDVSEKSPFYKAILWANENEITSVSGSKFKPNDVCTRAQTVAFMYRYLG